MIRVFLDANVYFAGFVSKTGASFFVLKLARRKKLAVVASKVVLREADRNLRLKSDTKTVKAFRRYLQEVKIQVVSTPSEKVLQSCEDYIHPKDVPVLAAAAQAKVDFLITLDRKHFLTAKAQSYSPKLKIMTSGDFIRENIHRLR